MEKLDITAEGFTLVQEATPPYQRNSLFVKDRMNERENTMGKRHVYYNDQNWVLICDGDDETPWTDWNVRFAGVVDTQEDFKKLLTQLP